MLTEESQFIYNKSNVLPRVFAAQIIAVPALIGYFAPPVLGGIWGDSAAVYAGKPVADIVALAVIALMLFGVSLVLRRRAAQAAHLSVGLSSVTLPSSVAGQASRSVRMADIVRSETTDTGEFLLHTADRSLRFEPAKFASSEDFQRFVDLIALRRKRFE